MGRNAQRRRAAREAAKPHLTIEERQASAERRLWKAKLAQLPHRAAFEGALAQMEPWKRDRARKLLAPLLPKHLPCCDAAGKPLAMHQESCPWKVRFLARDASKPRRLVITRIPDETEAVVE